MSEETRAPNPWLGEKIGTSPSGASLLRRGKRPPTLPRMRVIEDSLGWEMCDQTVLSNDEWATELNSRANKAYAEETKATDAENQAVADRVWKDELI